MEIVNNQEMEHEDPFLVELALNSGKNEGKKKFSIDVMADLVLDGQALDITRLKQIHRLIIRGSSDDVKSNYQLRDFDTYVFEVNDGVESISYNAPSPDEIKPYLKKMYSFLESNSINGELDILYKPILEHFYVAALQPFGNGNTRLARALEYVGIFKLTRDKLGSKIELPALYMSKNHLQTRKQYRDNIAEVVNYPTDESMNKWIDYNLNMIDEQLYYCKTKLYKASK